uniref:Uncharacterized protein n=1 Tax=viral metagenome TaxID=1070528 RepID=A0A6C0LY48_9ZZZZ
MAFTYSGIVNYGKSTLPSVEGWGSNMNILKDPPKSITTRRINRVGQTSSITEMIDQSENRAAEAIQVYARGVNPCVSVSYSNYGNNGGGGQSGGLTGLSQPIAGLGRQAKLPFTIMKDGAFRPPVLTQRDLLPLSRLPRALTSVKTQPGFTDFSKKVWECKTAEKTREVKTTTLQACVRPTARYIVQTPLKAPSDVKFFVNKKLNVTVNSGVRAMNITQQYIGDITKEIYAQPLHAMANANHNDSTRYVNNNTVNTDKYIQEVNATNANTNFSSQHHHTNIEEILDLANLPVQDIRTTKHTASVSGVEKVNYIHEDVFLRRNIPEYQLTANSSDKRKYQNQLHENEIILSRNNPQADFSSVVVDKSGHDNDRREAYLAPKLQPGGFTNASQKPMIGRMQNVSDPVETQKSKTSRFVTESMKGRFGKSAPWHK